MVAEGGGGGHGQLQRAKSVLDALCGPRSNRRRPGGIAAVQHQLALCVLHNLPAEETLVNMRLEALVRDATELHQHNITFGALFQDPRACGGQGDALNANMIAKHNPTLAPPSNRSHSLDCNTGCNECAGPLLCSTLPLEPTRGRHTLGQQLLQWALVSATLVG